MNTSENLMNERLDRIQTAIALGTPDRVPCAVGAQALPYSVSENGATYRDSMYDYKKAGQAWIDFYKKYPICDAHTFSGFDSGKANEVAQTAMIDWPGRPGNFVPDHSTYQAIEIEFMTADEYPELLRDYTGFMLRKYYPKAYPALRGFTNLDIHPMVFAVSSMGTMLDPSLMDSFQKMSTIQKYNAEALSAAEEVNNALADMGIPPLTTGAAEAPFDILSDYFRGTMGTFDDLILRPELIAEACDLFADIQIRSFDYFNYVPMVNKCVFFPLHKGMDGFMSAKQYDELYWQPLLKLIYALVDMGVTPFLYSEGKYNTRLEQMTDLPKGKVLIHFEDVDMARAKKVFEGTACISGNLPIYLLEHGTPEQVTDYMKRLFDVCAPGGGYIFDTNAWVDGAKRENVDAMFEAVELYGKY